MVIEGLWRRFEKGETETDPNFAFFFFSQLSRSPLTVGD